MELTISLDTYKALTLLLNDEQDSYEEVIRRLLAARESAQDGREATPKLPEMAGWFGYGVMLPVGTRLRKRLKGEEYVATVQQDGLEFEGQLHNSLSSAGTAITGYNLNGWAFWEYQNLETGQWESVAKLRKDG